MIYDDTGLDQDFVGMADTEGESRDWSDRLHGTGARGEHDSASPEAVVVVDVETCRPPGRLQLSRCWQAARSRKMGLTRGVLMDWWTRPQTRMRRVVQSTSTLTTASRRQARTARAVTTLSVFMGASMKALDGSVCFGARTGA